MPRLLSDMMMKKGGFTSNSWGTKWGQEGYNFGQPCRFSILRCMPKEVVADIEPTPTVTMGKMNRCSMQEVKWKWYQVTSRRWNYFVTSLTNQRTQEEALIKEYSN